MKTNKHNLEHLNNNRKTLNWSSYLSSISPPSFLYNKKSLFYIILLLMPVISLIDLDAKIFKIQWICSIRILGSKRVWKSKFIFPLYTDTHSHAFIIIDSVLSVFVKLCCVLKNHVPCHFGDCYFQTLRMYCSLCVIY